MKKALLISAVVFVANLIVVASAFAGRCPHVGGY